MAGEEDDLELECDEATSTNGVPFTPGKTYRRKLLHDQFGGQRFGGIATPVSSPFVFLFSQSTHGNVSLRTDESLRCGYKDGWTAEKDMFLYTGTGRLGDQSIEKGGNRAIKYHKQNGKRLLVFSFSGVSGLWIFEGEMEYVKFHTQTSYDIENNARECLVFVLKPVTQPRTTNAATYSPSIPPLHPASPPKHKSFIRMKMITKNSAKKNFLKLLGITSAPPRELDEDSTRPTEEEQQPPKAKRQKTSFDLDDILGKQDDHLQDMNKISRNILTDRVRPPPYRHAHV
jgi:hypothetical protein